MPCRMGGKSERHGVTWRLLPLFIGVNSGALPSAAQKWRFITERAKDGIANHVGHP